MYRIYRLILDEILQRAASFTPPTPAVHKRAYINLIQRFSSSLFN